MSSFIFFEKKMIFYCLSHAYWISVVLLILHIAYSFLCRFLSMLEEEVYGANSPIWDVEFSQNAANMATSPPTTRKKWLHNVLELIH